MTSKKKPVTSKELLVPPRGPGVHLLQAPKTFKFARSSVLSQVQFFLPQLAKANTALQERVESEGSEGVAVECSEEEEKETHIEMDLAVVPLSGSDEDDSSSTYQSSSDDDDERPVASSVDEVDLKASSSSSSVTRCPLMIPSSSSCRPSHHSRPHHKIRLIEEMISKT